MCGRFLLLTSRDDVVRTFGAAAGPPLTPRYNIAPTQPIAIVRRSESVVECVLARWGLIPSWAKDVGFGAHTINARSETLHEKPAFRSAFKRRRCLVPADGFYEWKKVGKEKQPHVIRSIDGSLLAFAGLWEHWQGPGGEEIESATIVTTEANELLRPLHDRMPVILTGADRDIWLDPQSDVETLSGLFRPLPAEELTLSRVGTWVSDARHEGERCLMPEAELFA